MAETCSDSLSAFLSSAFGATSGDRYRDAFITNGFEDVTFFPKMTIEEAEQAACTLIKFLENQGVEVPLGHKMKFRHCFSSPVSVGYRLKPCAEYRPLKIILVRHGESLANVDETILGTVPDWQVPLSERGVQQALEAGQKIRELVSDCDGFPALFYVSPFKRTVETYQHIMKSFEGVRTRTHVEPRLREQDFGNFQDDERMKKCKSDRSRFGHFFYRFPDGGESGADVYDRVSSFLETLHRDFTNPDCPRTAILVTHGLTSRLFLMRWFHWSVQKFEATCNPGNCEFFVMEKQCNMKYKLVTEPRFWKAYEDAV